MNSESANHGEQDWRQTFGTWKAGSSVLHIEFGLEPGKIERMEDHLRVVRNGPDPHEGADLHFGKGLRDFGNTRTACQTAGSRIPSVMTLSYRAWLRVALLLSVATVLPIATLAHPVSSRPIIFPDVPGYLTLVGDFHQHTVFSDGSVWPNIRVEEAIRDGLDAVAITDHLEYQPHEADIPHPDRNRSHAIAANAAREESLIVIRGAEVTRKMPPGHVNAIFIQDANALRQPEPIDAFREAAKQNAFIFWNHPAWLDQTPDGVARLTPLHEQLLNEQLIHGIEVVNEHDYSDEALQIALDRNLTIMGNSDIHGLIDWEYNIPDGGHRPVTLVFAEEKTEAALKAALVGRRTVVWFKNTLIGRAEWMDPLLAASLTVASAAYAPKTTVLEVVLTNHSDVDFQLRNASSYGLHQDAGLLMVGAHKSETILVKTLQHLQRIELHFEVMNAVTAPRVHPTITFKVEAAVPGPASSP